MKLEVPSRGLARAWQAAQIAASNDDARPMLCRSALVEVFWGHGLRLVSTDTYILVRAWVSLDPEGGYLEPPVDEEPDETFIVADPDHRGLGLLKYIHSLYRKELDETAVPMVTITKCRAVPDDQGVFEGLESEALHIDWPEHEEVILPILEGDFPVWRHLVDDERTEATDTISFTPRTLGAVAKLGELYKGRSIDWTLNGDTGVIRFEVGPLSGLLMPARPDQVVTPDQAEVAEPR